MTGCEFALSIIPLSRNCFCISSGVNSRFAPERLSTRPAPCAVEPKVSFIAVSVPPRTYEHVPIVLLNTEEIEQIKARNKRVELDKSWETSWTRKVCIMILTYIVVVIYSIGINHINNVFLSSVVPVIGFTLSTLSLRLIRKIWEKNKK